VWVGGWVRVYNKKAAQARRDGGWEKGRKE
jgi:hypothetical protein